MASVKITPRFQVDIPKEFRRKSGIKPGARMQVFRYGDFIEFVRVMPVKWYRGCLKGIDTNVPRE